jgi:acyl carrier protein phosphodiesterase
MTTTTIEDPAVKLAQLDQAMSDIELRIDSLKQEHCRLRNRRNKLRHKQRSLVPDDLAARIAVMLSKAPAKVVTIAKALTVNRLMVEVCLEDNPRRFVKISGLWSLRHLCGQRSNGHV